MIVLRLLSVFIFSALLTGCAMLDEIRRDFSAATIYLSGLYAPQECHLPGQHVSSHACLYKLEIINIEDASKGRYVARIAQDVFLESIKQCKNTMETIQEEYKNLRRRCPESPEDPLYYPNRLFQYTVHVDVDPKHPQDIVKDGIYWFLSVAGSNHITPITANGKELPAEQRSGIPF
jgi:hypothetical protein